MIKMLELRKKIKAALALSGLPVFYQKATRDTPFPYLTFDINNSTDDGTLERFVMDVDIWGKDKLTNGLDEGIDIADKNVHRKTFTVTSGSTQLAFTVYRENRLTFDESDDRLYHRRYIYQVRAYQQGD